MKWPKLIKHRKSSATIYRKTKAYPYYRVSYNLAGKRHLLSFPDVLGS